MEWILLCEGLSESREVHSFAEVEQIVERAIELGQKRYDLPTLVELSSSENAMGIVVGGVHSYAVFKYLPNGPIGVARPQDVVQDSEGEAMVFMVSGSRCEVDWCTAIPPDEAWEAFRLYFETGQLPETLEWGP